jgi:hypothetical protein
MTAVGLLSNAEMLQKVREEFKQGHLQESK